MKILKAEEGKIYQSLIDSSVYATTIYLADNDSESNYKLIDESEVIMTTEELEEDEEVCRMEPDTLQSIQSEGLVDDSELFNQSKR